MGYQWKTEDGNHLGGKDEDVVTGERGQKSDPNIMPNTPYPGFTKSREVGIN